MARILRQAEVHIGVVTARRFLPVVSVSGLFALLAVGLPAQAAKSMPLAVDEISALVAPRLGTAPTIDGTLDATEWREAVAVSGVVFNDNCLLPRPTTFYLGWDPKHLYMACRTYLRPGYKLDIPYGRSPGQAFVFDDGLELVFKPMGKNLSPEYSTMAYKLFINCLGHMGDMTRLDLGQQLKDWQPQFKVATRVTAPGTAPNGGSWWELEASMSPEDFQLTGDHRAGDQWRIMLGINHFAGFNQCRVPCVGPYFEPSGYTRVTLMENVPAVQFTMDSLSNLASDGTAFMQVKAYNLTAKEAAVNLNVAVADAIKKGETQTLAPQAEETILALNEKLPAGTEGGKMGLSVRHGETELLRYHAYFKVGHLAWVMAPVKPHDPKTFTFQTTFNPVRKQLLIKADTWDLQDPEAAALLAYEVKNADTGGVIHKGEIGRLVEWYFEEVVSLPNLKEGKYSIEANLKLKDGSSIGPMAKEFEKLNEAKSFPEWWGKDYGNIERVLPPSTAVRSVECQQVGCEGGTPKKIAGFSCWGREYAVTALGLPEAMNSQGEAVLAAPARIVTVVGGKEHVVEVGTPIITEKKDWRVRFEGKAQGAGLTFAAKGWLEQDGLVYTELTYAPAGEGAVEIDALRIEYAIAEADADCLLCIGPGNNFSSKTTMLLPRDQQGQLWSTLTTGRPGSQMTVGSFYPTVWIGNERRGFLWWGDNDKGWFPANDVPAHEAVRDSSNAVVFRNNIIGKTVSLSEPRTIAFSYMATPFKPLTKSWRSVAVTTDGTFIVPHRGVRNDSKTGQKVRSGQYNIIHPESRYPEEWAALWKEQKEGQKTPYGISADAHVARYLPSSPTRARNAVNWSHMSFTLSGYGPITLEDHLYKYFGSEWETRGRRPWNPSCIDYAMYLFHRAFSEGGVVSTYWDITFPMLFGDLLTGLSYRMPDGRIQKGYNGWNQRRFFMRLHAVAHDNGLLPNCNGSHSTHAYVPIAMPWLNAVLDGERTWNLDATDQDWVDYYPIERMRAMSVPHNWGTAICWMSNLQSQDGVKAGAAKTAQAEWVWMHDSWINMYLNPRRHDKEARDMSAMPDAVLDWGLNSEGVEYHPYWRNPFVQSDDEDILVSLWRIPGQGGDGKSDRVILGIFNYNGKAARPVSLQVDLDGLGLLPQRKWQDFVRVRDLYIREDIAQMSPQVARNVRANLDFYNRTLTIKRLKPHTLRLIGIRRY